MKTLVLVFHPDMSASRVNRPLAAKAETLGDDVTVRYMYDIYPDQKVDVAAEQAALEAADRVVLQFPMYWYSTPALLKQWEDDVLLYGWAYGSTGSREASYGYTITELLRPLQATANMVQMAYLEPFTTTGTLTITDEALAQRVEDYAATLASKDLPVLEPHG